MLLNKWTTFNVRGFFFGVTDPITLVGRVTVLIGCDSVTLVCCDTTAEAATILESMDVLLALRIQRQIDA